MVQKPVEGNMTTAVIYDSVYKEHLTGPGDPESPRRCDAVMSGIADTVPSERFEVIEPRKATEEEVALCHVPRQACSFAGCYSRTRGTFMDWRSA
jgi:acetoin utilization deacetylase AcuC-like enzyme